MESNKNDSKQLALAAVMFFSPMVNNFLKQNQENFSDKEKSFITSYIQYGYISIGSGLLTILAIIGYYLFPSMILYRIHTIAIAITIGILGIGSIGAISGSIIRNRTILGYRSLEDDPAQIILYFLPIYNIYLRYKEHNFEKPNIWIKESVLIWTIGSMIITITQSSLLLIIMCVMISIRIATIATKINIIPDHIQHKYNQLFDVNPEEVRAYGIASIGYIKQKIQNKMIQPSWQELLIAHKKSYSHLMQPSTAIIIQYSIGIVCTIFIITTIDPTRGLLYFPIAVLIGRYVIMYIQRKHLPNLPVAKEIQETITTVYRKITNQ